MSEPTKFAEFVLPELSKSRLDTQWARIVERRSERKRQSATVPAIGVLVAACALAVLWWPREWRTGGEASVWEGSVVASDDAPVGMTLAEGTRIQVDPRSEVKLLHSSAQAVQVRLSHGSARFQVAKKRARRFSVNLGKVEVVVTGTQFRVFRRPVNGERGERVQVQVEEGSVEVHRGDGGIVALHAGEHWSILVAPDDTTNEEQFTGATLDGESGSAHRSGGGASDVDGVPDSEEASQLEAQDDGESQDDDEAQDDNEARADGADSAVGADGLDRRREPSRARRALARRRAMREAASDAGELLDHANLARRAGRLEDAAELYADLVGRYPRDRRASLAAFELGRLRMDSLRDMHGAVQALERALKLDDRGAFAEDALARLVLAEEALGDHTGCGRAQTRYLARYPEGVHAQHVAERCGGGR